MMLTRVQIDNLSREELIEELLKFSDITDKLNGMNIVICPNTCAPLIFPHPSFWCISCESKV